MFEREIKYINDISINKLQSLGNHIGLGKLERAGVHPAIVQYIKAEIDFLLFEDRQKLLRNSIFDYSGENIDNYLLLINEEIKNTKSFSREYISKLMLHATSFTVNYLTRPNWTLLRFLFDNEKSKSTVEIKQILNYLYYYDYFKEVIVSYLDKKRLLKINRDELAELIGKIDLAGSETNRFSIIETAAKSISGFFNIADTRKTRVSIPALEMFLEDKKYDSVLSRLKNDSVLGSKTVVEFSELQHFLKKMEEEQKAREIEEVVDEDVCEEPDDEIIEEGSEYSNELKEAVTIELKGTTHTPTPAIEILDDEETDEEIEETEQAVEEETSEPEVEEEFSEAGFEDTENDRTEDTITDDVQEELPELIMEDEEVADEEDIEEEGFDKTEEKFETEQIGFEFEDSEEIEDVENIIEGDSQADNEKFEVLTSLEEEESEPEIVEAADEIDEMFEEMSDVMDLNDKVEQSDYSANKIDLKVPIGDASSKLDPEVLRKFNEQENNTVKIDGEMFEEIIEENVPETADEKSKPDDFDNGFMNQNELDEIVGEPDAEADKAEAEPEEQGDEAWDMYAETEAEKDKPQNDEETEQMADDTTGPVEELPEIDISDLLEHKKITRIIENIFDYDMEEFANVIDKISECKNKQEALTVLDEVYRINQVKPKSKDAELFKEIISEYYDRN